MSTPFYSPPGGPATVLAAKTKNAIYPCVNLGIVASTPLHLWQDPCKAPYSVFRVESIQILAKPGDTIRRAPYRPGEGFAYVERHETSSNIFLAPGYNPAVLDGGDFWARYWALRKQNDVDADLLAAKALAPQFRRDQEQLTISLIPLLNADPYTGSNKIIIDHSMLAFLLDLDGVWADLRTLYHKEDHREAVILVCRSIAAMAQADRDKYPAHAWNARQERVLSWCRTASAGRAYRKE